MIHTRVKMLKELKLFLKYVSKLILLHKQSILVQKLIILLFKYVSFSQCLIFQHNF